MEQISEEKKKLLNIINDLGDGLGQESEYCLTLVNINKIKNNLLKASQEELQLSVDVVDWLEKKQFATMNANMTEFLRGGYIFFDDEDAALYKKWTSFHKNKYNRDGKSSHKSHDSQYAIRGPFVKEALFGTKIDASGKRHTWLQLESHPTGIRYLLGHLISYLLYKITKKNIGPYGKSNYREVHPLTIETMTHGKRKR